VRIVFAEGIEPIVDAMDLWWRTHRLAAPDLFAEELELACARIAEQPDRYPVHKATSRGIVRRALMPGTRNHVYYVHRPGDDVVQVVSVWGGPRGTEPELR
jgi:hypothetical protein